MEIVKNQDNVYFISLKKGSEFLQTLTDFCNKEGIRAGYLTAIGACDVVTLSWYNLQTKKYEDMELREGLEITNIIGNIALVEGKPFIHAHGVFAKRDFTVVGGHLRKMVISAACEVRLEVYNGDMERAFDAETGLNLLA